MFQSQLRTNKVNSTAAMFRLMFHIAVHDIRKGHGNAVMAILVNFSQAILMIALLFFTQWLMGRSGMRLRGDQMVYIIGTVGLFLTHVKAMGAVTGAGGPTSAMMKHGPMNPVVAIGGAALGALYMQTMLIMVLFFGYHCAWQPITIDEPKGFMAMMFLAWLSGLAIGLLFRSLTPWAPGFFGIFSTIYRRANIISSGKMLVANMAPGYLLVYFSWNPLFHIIDQGRGFMFLNYEPHRSNLEYPLIVTLICFVLGMIGERFTSKRVSLSWGAGK